MVIGLHVGSKNYFVDSVESMPGVKNCLVDNVESTSGVKITSSTASKAHRE